MRIRVRGRATVIGDSSVGVSISGDESDSRTWTSNGSVSASWTFPDVEELRLTLETEGMAVLRLHRITIWQDTDGNGLPDGSSNPPSQQYPTILHASVNRGLVRLTQQRP